MNSVLRNWKTTLAGIIGVVVSVSSIWAPPEYQQKIAATGAAILASGLLMAKDSDKTGLN